MWQMEKMSINYLHKLVFLCFVHGNLQKQINVCSVIWQHGLARLVLSRCFGLFGVLTVITGKRVFCDCYCKSKNEKCVAVQ